jgi:hypothetical protein
MDLKKAKAAEVRQSAGMEMKIPNEELIQLSKKALIEKIWSHRVQEETYLGMENISHVVLDAEHPFTISARPGSSYATIKITFMITKDSVSLRKGQRPLIQNIF